MGCGLGKAETTLSVCVAGEGESNLGRMIGTRGPKTWDARGGVWNLSSRNQWGAWKVLESGVVECVSGVREGV